MSKQAVRDTPIPMCNAKGAYSDVLGEFVALGVLFHDKKVKHFMKMKEEKKWSPQPVLLTEKRHMVIVGYGDIGASCARVAKFGFNMKVTGIKRNPA